MDENPTRLIWPGRALIGASGVLAVLALPHWIGGASGKPLLEPLSGHAWGFLFATAFAAVQLGLGRWLLDLAPWRGAAGALSRAGWAFALGLGLWGTTVGLAVLGLLGAGSLGFALFVAATVVPAAAGWRTLLAELRARPVDRLRAPGRPAMLAVAGACIFALPFVAQAALPDADWDSAQYHLPMANAFAEHGLWTDDYVLSAFYRPGNGQLVYSAFFALGAELAIVPFGLLLVVAAGAVVGLIARAVFGAGAVWWAVALYAGTNIIAETGLDARVEPFLEFGFLVAVLAFLAWRRDPSRRGAMLVAVAMAGLAGGTKYNGLVFAALVALPVAALLLAGRGGSTDVGTRARLAALAFLVLILPSGIWYARNAFLLGDPLYPFWGGPLHRNAAGELVHMFDPVRELPKSKAAPHELRADLVQQRQTTSGERRSAVRGLPMLVDALVHPDAYTTKPYHWTNPFLLLFFLVPLFCRAGPALWLFGLGLAGAVWITAATQVLRYLIPLLALFAAGGGAVAARLRPPWLRTACGFGIGGWLAFVAGSEYVKLAEREPLRYWSGEEDALGYLERVGYNGERVMPLVIRWLNAQVASGAIATHDKVFMIGEAKGHLLACDYLPSTSSSGKEWLVEYRNADGDLARMARSLWDRGFRYVLLNKLWIDYNLRNGIKIRRRHLATTLYTVEKFQAEHGERPVFGGDVVLFRIRPPG